MKTAVILTLLLSFSAMADRFSDEDRIDQLHRKIEEAREQIPNSTESRSSAGPEEEAILKAYWNARARHDYSKLRFFIEVGKFVEKYQYLPTSAKGLFDIEAGSIDYVRFREYFWQSQIACPKVSWDGYIGLNIAYCPMKYQKIERAANAMVNSLLDKVTKQVENEAAILFATIGAEAPPIVAPVKSENLGRGYRRRISGAGVLTIERAYPNSKKPKMILIGYEGIGKLEKNTVVPLAFTFGDETKSLEYQIGNEIPEDEVIKGQRILTLQILRFKKRPKEKPDALSNKELAAIEDFVKQFDGKEISDSDNVLLTEIYPDPDDAKKQIAATWRVSFDSSKPAVELGYQMLQVSGGAK